MNRRSRSGQSIILVAFMFIVLIAFVGIATDVAMLFVRYSTLRRAVDAAAIAAAGQVRETTDYMTLNAVARQFIQIHGIDANTVKIDTCETEQLALINDNPGMTAAQALNILIDPARTPPSELCKRSPQKLIRVTAQIASPTAFLSMLGWKSVTLEASSVAQTAVLDVALVLDTSLSEAYDTYSHQSVLTNPATGSPLYQCRSIDGTTGADAATVNDPNCLLGKYNGSNRVELKDFRDFTNPSPYVDSGGGKQYWAPNKNDPDTYWGLGLDPYGATAPKDATHSYLHGGAAIPIRSECWALPFNSTMRPWANYAWAGCCNDPTTQSDDAPGGVAVIGYPGGAEHAVYDSAGQKGNLANLAALRNPANVTGLNPDPNWYVYDDDVSSLPESVIMISGRNPFAANPATTYAAKVLSGDPDGNKSDLICRPFKEVRDAARRFIRRMDFVRGDRVFLVTFDSQPRVIVPYGTTSGVQVITDKTTAIKALNEQVGVEVNPANVYAGCQSRSTPLWNVPGFTANPPRIPPIPPDTTDNGPYTDPNYFLGVNLPKNVQSYWTVAQCPDTNTGGGILAATAALVNPNWIRRESVWVMIVLSDGYPNRTPPVAGNDVASDIFSAERNWVQTNYGPGMPDYTGDNSALIAQYCVDTSPDYGMAPQICTTLPATYNPPYPWGLSKPANGVGLANAKGSFGFCPWWTFCDLFSNDTSVHGDATKPQVDDYNPYPKLDQCTENNPRGIWMPPVPPAAGGSNTWPAVYNQGYYTDRDVLEPYLPLCTDTDPNARHFCMDGEGKINPGTQTAGPNHTEGTVPESPQPPEYYCDPHYDATDYARDRADFAGLINYMDRSFLGTHPPKKGNFIAIYSIFFDHAGKATLDENILGVKFMRYLADVGDNGMVDNRLQKWYRDVRDGVITAGPLGDYPGQAWLNPPTGLNESATANVQTPGSGTFPGRFDQGTQKTPPQGYPVGGGQPVPPTYNGADGVWGTAFGYKGPEDPCAAYDYVETGRAPVPGDGNSLYEKDAKTDCGQYFYASDILKVNQAFLEIASRLFTRLSR